MPIWAKVRWRSRAAARRSAGLISASNSSIQPSPRPARLTFVDAASSRPPLEFERPACSATMSPRRSAMPGLAAQEAGEDAWPVGADSTSDARDAVGGTTSRASTSGVGSNSSNP